MRKAFVLILVAALVLGFAGTACAENGPVKKLGRGLANVITCPVGLFQGMNDVYEESGFMAASTWGVITGVINVVKRVAVGAYETVTFPIPVPEGYEPILTDPEFYFQSEMDVYGDEKD